MKALGSLADVERELRAAGVLRRAGAHGLVADVYLGYGLSRSLRRTDVPDPPEPCRLPAAAVGIRRVDEPAPPAGAFRIGEWKATVGRGCDTPLPSSAFGRRSRPATSTRSTSSSIWRRRSAATRRGLGRLRSRRSGRSSRAPLAGDGWAVVSASPELFLAGAGRRVWTQPIKGTRPLGESAPLESAKDAAEHVMIVDLERNDLRGSASPARVRWPELMAEHELAGVVHLVSTVEGALRADVGLRSCSRRVSPAGR